MPGTLRSLAFFQLPQLDADQQKVFALCFSELANCVEIVRSGQIKRCNRKILGFCPLLTL